MPPLTQQILRTDLAGMPLEWVDYRDAARHMVTACVRCNNYKAGRTPEDAGLLAVPFTPTHAGYIHLMGRHV